MIRVLTLDGRWICDASLIQRKPYLTESRIADGKKKSDREKIKRRYAHIQEVKDRSRAVFEATAQEDPVLVAATSSTLLSPTQSPTTEKTGDELEISIESLV